MLLSNSWASVPPTASFRSSLTGLNVPVAAAFRSDTNDLYILNNMFGGVILLSRSSPPYDSYSHVSMGPSSLSPVYPGVIVPTPFGPAHAYPPMPLAFKPGSQDLYIANNIDGSIQKAVFPYGVSTFFVGLGSPTSMAFQPNTGDLFFATSSSSSLRGVFHVPIPIVGKPVAVSSSSGSMISFNAANMDLYFSDTLAGTVSRIASPYTALPEVVIPSAGTVSGLAVDSQGCIYTSEATNHKVKIYQNDGTLIQTLGTSGVSGSGDDQFNSPGALSLNSDNTVLAVADTGNARVVLFSISRTPAVKAPSAPTVAAIKAVGLPPDVASAIGGVLSKNPELGKVFSGLTGAALKEAIQQTQPQGNAPGAAVSAGAMSTSQGNVGGQQDSARSDFRESQKNYAGYSSLQLTNLQMLKDDNSSSQFKYLEFFASPIKNPTIPSFHGFDDYAERPLPSSTRVRGKRVNLWIQNNTQLHNTSNHGGFTGMHSFTKGGTSGIDYRLTDKFLIGFMGGGAFTDYNLRLNKGNGEVKNVFTGLYGTISMPKDFSLDVSFIVGRNYFKNNRNINLPGLSLVANESHKGLNLSSRFKVGTTFNLKKVEVSPYVGFGYLRSTENGYTETNAGSLNLSVLSKRNQFLQAETGVKFSKDFLVNEVAWNPNASIGLSRDQAYNLKSKVTSSFVGETNNFVIDGNNSKKNQVSTNLSLAVVFKSGAYVNVGYSAKFNRSEQTHEAVIRIGKKF